MWCGANDIYNLKINKSAILRGRSAADQLDLINKFVGSCQQDPQENMNYSFRQHASPNMETFIPNLKLHEDANHLLKILMEPNPALVWKYFIYN